LVTVWLSLLTSIKPYILKGLFSGLVECINLAAIGAIGIWECWNSVFSKQWTLVPHPVNYSKKWVSSVPLPVPPRFRIH
jgi:hypothetical protein